MRNRGLSAVLWLVGVAMVAGCGATATVAGRGAPKVSQTTKAPGQTGQQSANASAQSVQGALQEARVHGIDMTSRTSGWAYSPEHVWLIAGGGTTWHLVWHQATQILAFVAPSRTDAWAVTVPAGAQRIEVWHTVNGGRTWSSATAKASWPVVTASLTIDEKGYGHVLVAGPPAPQMAPDALFAIEHGQLVSTPVFSTTGSGLGDIVFSSNQDGVAVDVAVVGSQKMTPPLFRTTDGGVTWQPVILPSPPGYSPVSGSQRAAQYVVQPPVSFVSLSTGYAVLESPQATLCRTTNAGASWIPLTGPPVAHGYGVSASWLTPQRGWVMTGSRGPSTLWGTSDGGQTWTRLSSGYFITVPQFVSAADGWALLVPRHPNAYGGPLTVIRTINGGRTWTPVTVH